MANHLLNDPKHGRGRAKAMRLHAHEMADSIQRRMMLKIADDYESPQSEPKIEYKEQAAQIRTALQLVGTFYATMPQ